MKNQTTTSTTPTTKSKSPAWTLAPFQVHPFIHLAAPLANFTTEFLALGEEHGVQIPGIDEADAARLEELAGQSLSLKTLCAMEEMRRATQACFRRSGRYGPDHITTMSDAVEVLLDSFQHVLAEADRQLAAEQEANHAAP